MNEWKESKLKDITIFIKDGTHGSHKDVPDGIPLLSAKDIENGKILIRDNCRTVSEIDYKLLHTHYEIENGDLLLTVVGTIGRVAIAKELLKKITFQRSVSIIRIDKSKVSPDYSFHYFQSNRFQQTLERSKNASAQGGVYLGELAKANIFHPNLLSKQKEIAHILTTCDAVIAQTQSAISKYKAIKQGLLHDLFTRGLDANRKLRPSYQDSPELYKVSELGMIPKEWEVKELKHYFNFISYGFTNPMPDCKEGPYMITAANINNGKIEYESARRTSQILFNTILTDKSRPKIGDLLLTKDGSLGRVAIVEKENVCINQSVAVIRFNDIQRTPFFKILLQTPIYQKKMLDDAGGSTIKHIYITIVDKMLIAIPKKPKELDFISNRIHTIENKIRTEEALLQKYQSIKRGLMGDLLGGKKKT